MSLRVLSSGIMLGDGTVGDAGDGEVFCGIF